LRLVAFLLAALALSAQAQDYPSRPIRLITPAAPGGTTDILSRLVGAKLTEMFRQQVLVDNRASASGAIASQITASAPADGYTLLLAYHQNTINAALDPKLAHHPVESFTPITQLTSAGLLLVVHPSSPPRTLQEFVQWTRTVKEPLNFGSAGIGSGGHLAGELYKLMAGVKAEHIPYKGAGPSLADLVGARYHYNFAGMAGSVPLARSGKLRALAVTSPKRLDAMPDIPAVAEALPGFEVVGWYGIVGPPQLPAPIVSRLHTALVSIIGQPDIRERLVADGAEPVGSTPDEFRQFMLADIRKWIRVAKEAGLKLE
jgi:tripartite-type tricarboxylate transporter receptor subunit TctC